MGLILQDTEDSYLKSDPDAHIRCSAVPVLLRWSLHKHLAVEKLRVRAFHRDAVFSVELDLYFWDRAYGRSVDRIECHSSASPALFVDLAEHRDVLNSTRLPLKGV